MASNRNKKGPVRETGFDEPKREFVDYQLFNLQYLNNSMNYILASCGDLDYNMQFDSQALKQIVAGKIGEKGVHFTERIKLMKTRFEGNCSVKDLQEYGEFINFDINKQNQLEMTQIEDEFKEEQSINAIAKKFKRIRKLAKTCSPYEAVLYRQQLKTSILNDLLQSYQDLAPTMHAVDLEQNKLYRQLFKLEDAKVEERHGRGRQRGSRAKHNPDQAMQKAVLPQQKYQPLNRKPETSQYLPVPNPTPQIKIQAEQNNIVPENINASQISNQQRTINNDNMEIKIQQKPNTKQFNELRSAPASESVPSLPVQITPPLNSTHAHLDQSEGASKTNEIDRQRKKREKKNIKDKTRPKKMKEEDSGKLSQKRRYNKRREGSVHSSGIEVGIQANDKDQQDATFKVIIPRTYIPADSKKDNSQDIARYEPVAIEPNRPIKNQVQRIDSQQNKEFQMVLDAPLSPAPRPVDDFIIDDLFNQQMNDHRF